MVIKLDDFFFQIQTQITSPPTPPLSHFKVWRCMIGDVNHSVVVFSQREFVLRKSAHRRKSSSFVEAAGT